jgi:hypothetical protein
MGFSTLKSSDNDFEFLLKSIKCNDQVDYWELNYVKGSTNPQTIFRSGDSKLKDKVIHSTNHEGFFPGCLPGFCNYHIIYLENGEQYNVTTHDSLKLFIGNVDNNEEAFLIALASGYDIDWNHWQGRSYQKISNGYKLKVSKIDYCPEKRESFLVMVDYNGKLSESKKLGIYYQTKNCIVF